jgi:hypothetical protein
VDPGDVSHKGITVVAPHELTELNEKRQYGKGLGNQAKAFGAGAARTLTFGGSDVAARAIGGSDTAEALGALKRQNPISSGAGEVAGALAPLALTGGASAAAEGGIVAAEGAEAVNAARAASGLGAGLRAAGKAATVVPRAISGAGSLVERGAARGLEALGYTGKTLASRAAAKAATLGAQGAVEGGLYGAQGAISDQALNDHDQTVEGFVSGLGHGALLGGVLGAGLGGLGELGGAALAKSKGSLEHLAEEHAGRSIGGQAELRKLKERAPQATGDMLKYELQTGEHAGQPLLAKGDKVDDIAAKLKQAVEEVGAKRNGVMSEIDAALRENPAAQAAAPSAEEFVNGVHESDWYRKLKNGPNRDKARAVDKQMKMLLEQDAKAVPVAAASADPLEAGVETFGYARDGMRDMTTHRGAYAGATPEEVQQIANGEIATKNSGIKYPDGEELAGKPFKPVRIHVEPDGIFLNDGRHRMQAAKEAGAKNIMAEIVTYDADMNVLSKEMRSLPISASPPVAAAANDVTQGASFAKLKEWQEQLRDVFQPRAGQAGGMPPPPPKAAAYLEKLERELKGYLDTKAEAALTALGEDPTAYKDLTRQLHSMLSLREVAKKTINHGNRILSPSDHGTGIAAFLASAVSGHPLGGLLYGGATAFANKLMRERGNATIAALARDASAMGGTLESTARKLTGTTAEATAAIAGLEGVSHETRGPSRAFDMPRAASVPALTKQYQETVAAVRTLANPTVAGEHVANTVASLSGDYPDVGASASRKLLEIYQHLTQAIPGAANSPSNSLTPKAVKERVPPQAMATYMATVRGATNPLAVIADLGRGEADRDALDAVQQFYPKMYQKLRDLTADMMAEREEEIPYQQSVFLSMALGFTGDSSLEPANIDKIQQTFAVMQQTGETQQSDRPTRPARQVDAQAMTSPMRLPNSQQQDM